MASNGTDLIDELIQKVLQKLNVTNYTIKIEPATKKGDNYLSNIYRIKTITNNNTITFIAKIAPNDEETRKLISAKNLFDSEIHFYQTIVPIFNEFQEKYLQTPFQPFPKCYHHEKEEFREALIFEDLKQRGFELLDWRNKIPDEYIECMMRTYGYYHAVSFALREKESEKFFRLIEDVKDALKVMMENYSETAREGIEKTFEGHEKYLEEHGGSYVLEKYRKASKNWYEIFTEYADNGDKQSVILHGDSQSRNVMFKKNPDTSSIEACLLDFQMRKIGSPALDLCYFLFSSLTGASLEKFDHFLQVYHDSLSKRLLEFECDPNVFTLDDLNRHIVKYGKFGFLFAILVMQVVYSEEEELVDLNSEDNAREMGKGLKRQEEASKCLMDVVSVAIEKGIL